MKIIHAEGEIGYELTARWLRSELEKAGGQAVQINLNSPGGDAFEVPAMMEVLRAYSGKSTIKIVSLAASAASRFCCAADEVICTSNSVHMRHLASGGTRGNSSDHDKTAEVLRGIDRQQAEDYARWSGLSVEQELEMMAETAWLFGKEIFEAGYATKYEEEARVTDRYIALETARDRFRACYHQPTEYEVAAYLKSDTAPVVKSFAEWKEEYPYNQRVQQIIARAEAAGRPPESCALALIMATSGTLTAEDRQAARLAGLTLEEYAKYAPK